MFCFVTYTDLADAQNKTIAFRKKKGDTNFKKKGATQEELNALANQELLADFIAEKLFNDADGLERLLKSLEPKTMRDFVQTILDVIRKLINKIKGVDNSFEENLRELEKKFSKMLKETAKNEKNTDGGVKLKIDEKNLFKYTKEQYNNFGWTRYDNILSAKQFVRLTEKIYELSKRNVYFNKTRDGQYIIPIGEDYGLYDVLVYTNDDAINPKISQVIKLADFADEYLKETIWKDFLNGKDITERTIERKISDVCAVWGEESIIRNVPRTSPSFQEYENATTQGNVSGQDSGRNGKRYDIGAVDTESKGNTNRNNENNIKLSIPSKTDTEYLTAVENGDMETAQRLVDEAAVNAGYTQKAYHGTGADFNIFSEENIGKRNVWGKGFYFGTSKGIADDYASLRASKGGKYRIVNAYLKMDNPYTPHKSDLGTAEEIKDRWFSDMWDNSRELGIGYIQGKLDNSPLDLLQFIAEHNNIEVQDVLKEYGYDSVKDGGELVVFNPNQIKSADPVTYDDNGNVIPLSERFNEEETDIRYSIPNTSTRSALADALSTLTQDESEMRIIEDYKNAVADIDKAQARLDQVNADIKQILFTNVKNDIKKPAFLRVFVLFIFHILCLFAAVVNFVFVVFNNGDSCFIKHKFNFFGTNCDSNDIIIDFFNNAINTAIHHNAITVFKVIFSFLHYFCTLSLFSA